MIKVEVVITFEMAHITYVLDPYKYVIKELKVGRVIRYFK